MRIAIEGCGHGTLHAIYASIKKACEVNGWKGIDLLIIGGDFQAVRNSYDLNTMSVPQKFRAIGDFHEYYSGARRSPYLTLFVGGNHEASSHLQELHYGGWVAPNIYYLGAANVVRFGNLRIAGLSGIWKGYSYNKPHFERLPYNQDEIKSLYHVREIDVRKLLLLRTQVDVGISHDWPRGVEWQGDWKALFRKKDSFEADARAGTLGSSAAKYVMDRLRPPYWFSAHMHCKFAAVIEHGLGAKGSQDASAIHGDNGAAPNGITNTDQIDIDGEENELAAPVTSEPTALIKNTDEIDLDMDDDDTPDTLAAAEFIKPIESINEPQSDSTTVPTELRSQLPASFNNPPPAQNTKPEQLPPPPEITNKRTEFLALDKCLPNRKFLQLLEIEPLSSSPNPPTPKLTYDKEWLSILRVFAQHDPHEPSPPNLGEKAYQPLISKEEEWVEENVVSAGKMEIPENFEITAPVFDGKAIGSVGREQPTEYSNSQTKTFCEMLGIPNAFDDTEEVREERRRSKDLQGGSDRFRGGSRGGRGGGRGNGRGRGGGRGSRGGGRGSNEIPLGVRRG